jgi:hypothetical protein
MPTQSSPLPCRNPDALVRAFPSLRRNKHCTTLDELRAAWKADGCYWSSGERAAAQFVFHVMDGAPFEVGRAMNAWDDDHRAVFVAWARNPWTW